MYGMETRYELRLPQVLLDRIKVEAERRGMSRAAYVRLILLAQYPDLKEAK